MSEPTPHRRRPRYAGKYPRRFEDKYKELDPSKNPETIAKVLASGKTPAGTHVPIMVAEILDILAPKSRETAVDCTLGHGGHARKILERLAPDGHLLGLDVDPLELPRTESSLRAEGFGADVFTAYKSNYAGISAALAAHGYAGADVILADLGVSSMQLDNPLRGFSTKRPGPLDMRLNPNRGLTAAQWLERTTPEKLFETLQENADEPHAAALASALAGKSFSLTSDLTNAIREVLKARPTEDQDKSVRRTFQAIRIAVNEEFTALEAFLRALPMALNEGGRVAILTFHSGEDRRVKKFFQAGFRDGLYKKIALDVIRPSAEECRSNPRATSAKLRWAYK